MRCRESNQLKSCVDDNDEITKTEFAGPIVLGGVIKIIYDLALYFNFRNIKVKDEY